MTEKPAPEPLVPPDVDLTDYGYVPLWFRRLFGSDTWIIGNPEEKVAALHLWCESWHQVPAASLPADDKLLADLSKANRRWPRLKAHALRGWILCADGRLYHPFLAEKAMEAWQMKRNQSKRGRAGADKRWGKDSHDSGDLFAPPGASSISTSTGAVMQQAMPKDGHRSEENRSERKEAGNPPTPRTSTPWQVPDWIPVDAWEGFEVMRKRIRKPLTDRARWLIVLELERLRDKEGQDPIACLDKATRCSWQDVYAITKGGGGRAPGGLADSNRSTASTWAKGGSGAKH